MGPPRDGAATPTGSGPASGDDGARSGCDTAVRAVEHLGEDAVRVWHALEGGREHRVDALVVAVGVGHRAVTSALALLELEGVVSRDGDRWRRGAGRGRR